jgi:hypothetical protein
MQYNRQYVVTPSGDAGISGEPSPDLWVLAGGVVAQHHVQAHSDRWAAAVPQASVSHSGRSPAVNPPGSSRVRRSAGPWLLQRGGRRRTSQQFQSERLDLGEHTVQRSMVGERTRQHDVVAALVGLEGWERGAHRLAQAAVDTDLVTLRPRIAACTISRPCAHRWLARFDAEGQTGLVDRSSAPHSSPSTCRTASSRGLTSATRSSRMSAVGCQKPA